MKYLYIDCEYEDGEHITSMDRYDDLTVRKFIEIYKMLKEEQNLPYTGIEWKTGDYGNSLKAYSKFYLEENLQWFQDMLPESQFGIHFIDTVKVYDVNRTEDFS